MDNIVLNFLLLIGMTRMVFSSACHNQRTKRVFYCVLHKEHVYCRHFIWLSQLLSGHRGPALWPSGPASRNKAGKRLITDNQLFIQVIVLSYIKLFVDTSKEQSYISGKLKNNNIIN